MHEGRRLQDRLRRLHNAAGRTIRAGRRLGRGLRATMTLPAAEKLETTRSVALAFLVEGAVRVAPLPALARRCGLVLDMTTETPAGTVVPPIPAFTPDEVRRVRSALRVMAVWPFGKGTCLRQSLVLGHLLRHRRPVLRLGVRVRGGVVGHAWLEVDGTTIGGDESFQPLVIPATTRPPSPGQ